MLIPRRKPYFAPNSFKMVLNSIKDGKYLNSTQELEKKVARSLNIPNPIIVASGRIGLDLILKNSNLKPNSEIILPSYTFGPLIKIIKDAGFKPITVDINDYDFQISVKSIKKKVNRNTGAIIATHLFGELCDIKEIVKIARSKRILLIEDCAQSIGATKGGKVAGSFGDVSISSFNIAKPLQGFTGGLVFGKNKKIIDKIRNSIKTSSYNKKGIVKDVVRGLIGFYLNKSIFWPVLMYLFSYKKIQNAFVVFYRKFETKRISDVLLHPLLSYIILINLKNYKKRLGKRRFIRDLYTKNLKGIIRFQRQNPDELGTVDMLIARVDCNVYKIRRNLALKGIDIAILDEIADICPGKDIKNTKYLYNKLIALPIYESMNQKEVDYISKNITRVIKTLKTNGD